MKREKIELRSFAEPLSAEERVFYGLKPEDTATPVWPQRCVNSMEPAAGTVPLVAEKSGSSAVFHVPVSAENLEAKKRNFGWVTKVGVWIAYIGIIGLFVSFYFAFALTEQRRISGDMLFLMSVTSIVVAFLGFYFVQFMRSVSPAFRNWLTVPAMKVRIKRATPYFTDLSFEFDNAEYAKLFNEENSHLLLAHIKKAVEERLAALQRHTKENPESPAAHFELGLAHERLGDIEQAESEFKRAYELEENNAASLRHIGACRFARGNVRGAEEALIRAEAMDEDDVDTMLLFAALYDATNRHDRAKSKLEAARSAAPEEPDIHVRIGEFHLRHGEATKAVEAFESALKYDPDHEVALLGLAMALLKDNDARASGVIERIKRNRPEVAEEMKKRLNALER